MQKACINCSSTFEITDEDLAFYDKVSPVYTGKKYLIPPPTFCPDCRQQKRLIWRNERNLCKRTCDLCNQSILSVYTSNTPITAYCSDCWWSDNWDQYATAREFDFQRPFFDQFEELMHEAPLIALMVHNNENSDYVNLETDSKDCYMNIGGHWNQNCYYNTYALHGKDCADNYWIFQCELLYESMNCEQCYYSAFLDYCTGCHDCFFGYDLKGCTNCIGCIGLRQKEYYLFNEPCSKEEFEKWHEKISKETGKIEVQQKFVAMLNNVPRRFAIINQSEMCTGDCITHCKNCSMIFEADKDQDNAYTAITSETRDVQDVNSVGWSELCYQIVAGTHLNTVSFAVTYLHGSDAQYCFNIFNSDHLFGCIGLKQAKYCILNKQYSKTEYEELVPRIIEHMQKTGEWGEFFPANISPFAYNETVAQEYFPMAKEEVIAKNWRWREREDSTVTVKKIIPASKLPDSIDDIPDDILNWAITCEKTQKLFKIQKGELDFYRKMKLPIPRFHPNQRYIQRTSRRNPRKLFDRTCDKCQSPIQTTYSPDRPEIVYCEECYLAQVY